VSRVGLPGWARRLAGSVLVGLAQGAAYYVVIVYLIPYLYASLAEGLGAPAGALQPPSRALVGLGLMLVGISVAARALRGNVASPLLSGLAVLLSYAITVYLMGGGTVRVEGLRVGDATVDASLDLDPLLAVAFVFYVIPGILIPLAEHFYAKAEEP